MTKSSQFTTKETVQDLLRRKAKESTEEFTLPHSGITCHISYLNGKKARMCQEIATKGSEVDEDLLWAAMIAESCLFNGEKLVAEDVDALLHALDYMTIVGKLGGAQSAESK